MRACYGEIRGKRDRAYLMTAMLTGAVVVARKTWLSAGAAIVRRRESSLGRRKVVERRVKTSGDAEDERWRGGGFPCWESSAVLLLFIRQGGERPEFVRLSPGPIDLQSNFIINPFHLAPKCRRQPPISVCQTRQPDSCLDNGSRCEHTIRGPACGRSMSC